MTVVLASLTAGLAGIGMAQALAAAYLVAAFASRSRAAPNAVGAASDAASPAVSDAVPSTALPAAANPAAPARPPISVLKPLHGAEPLLTEALASFFCQDYPDWQIVFGVQDAADPAVATVRALQASFPTADVALVVDPTMHGANRKIGNLINMLPAAHHDLLVIADSDVHVRPDYLDRLVAALLRPGVGLVTTLYAGVPAPVDPKALASRTALPGRFGATQITYTFLPGALLARALGRQDCLGATMALRRQDLDRIGGFHALVHHLADDNVLGRRIAALGLCVALADTVPLTTVPENTWRALFRHELRWARTVRALEPAGYAASVLQLPLAWALLTIPLAGGAPWSFGLLLAAWFVRAGAARCVDRALRPFWAEASANPGAPAHPQAFVLLQPQPQPDPATTTRRFGIDHLAALAFSCPVWLLPLRDILSIVVMLTSYAGRNVDWRGHGLRADTPPSTSQSLTLRPIEGTHYQ